MLLSPYPTTGERIRLGLLWTWCALGAIFLIVPIFVPVPLSFNSGSFFTFPLAGVSTRWYEVVLGSERWGGRSAIVCSLPSVLRFLPQPSAP
jgi:putative spermidine/putrescine transport system permease protein